MRDRDWSAGVHEALEVMSLRIKGMKEVCITLERVAEEAREDLAEMTAPPPRPTPLTLDDFAILQPDVLGGLDTLSAKMDRRMDALMNRVRERANSASTDHWRNYEAVRKNRDLAVRHLNLSLFSAKKVLPPEEWMKIQEAMEPSPTERGRGRGQRKFNPLSLEEGSSFLAFWVFKKEKEGATGAPSLPSSPPLPPPARAANA